MDFRKLAVGVVKLEVDRGVGLRPATADLGHGKFESLWLLDAHPVLGPGGGIQDRGAAGFEGAGEARGGKGERS